MRRITTHWRRKNGDGRHVTARTKRSCSRAERGARSSDLMSGSLRPRRSSHGRKERRADLVAAAEKADLEAAQALEDVETIDAAERARGAL